MGLVFHEVLLRTCDCLGLRAGDTVKVRSSGFQNTASAGIQGKLPKRG